VTHAAKPALRRPAGECFSSGYPFESQEANGIVDANDVPRAADKRCQALAAFWQRIG
jgi:hypothetical protein